ncbi:histidinol-phosphate/aromatic aminotransferase/cobyric acid decarboxylase-like protein [Rhizobium leguminosarum]|nr:histidinol-phosphate/aromatic aminotransferase/cobyric acid decarboxylase-like protein [Rhizobium leguminosarum]
MADAKLQAVLSALSPMARQLNALPSNQPGRDANCVKLNTNENPFPLPMMVLQSALAALERHYLYPEDDNLAQSARSCDFGQLEERCGNMACGIDLRSARS